MLNYSSQFVVLINRFAVITLLLFGLSAVLSAQTEQRVLFFGDSLTAGYGVAPEQAYPALIQAKIDLLELEAKVVVGAVSGDTSAGGLRRIDWMLRQPIDILLLALGANDGLRGSPNSATEVNLQAIIDKVKARYPTAVIIIAGMRLPPSFGLNYTNEFAALYPRLAQNNQTALIPFLLADVGGVMELNLADRIHPNPAGHQIIAQTVWQQLEPLLQ